MKIKYKEKIINDLVQKSYYLNGKLILTLNFSVDVLHIYNTKIHMKLNNEKVQTAIDFLTRMTKIIPEFSTNICQYFVSKHNVMNATEFLSHMIETYDDFDNIPDGRIISDRELYCLESLLNLFIALKTCIDNENDKILNISQRKDILADLPINNGKRYFINFINTAIDCMYNEHTGKKEIYQNGYKIIFNESKITVTKKRNNTIYGLLLDKKDTFLKELGIIPQDFKENQYLLKSTIGNLVFKLFSDRYIKRKSTYKISLSKDNIESCDFSIPELLEIDEQIYYNNKKHYDYHVINAIEYFCNMKYGENSSNDKGLNYIVNRFITRHSVNNNILSFSIANEDKKENEDTELFFSKKEGQYYVVKNRVLDYIKRTSNEQFYNIFCSVLNHKMRLEKKELTKLTIENIKTWKNQGLFEYKENGGFIEIKMINSDTLKQFDEYLKGIQTKKTYLDDQLKLLAKLIEKPITKDTIIEIKNITGWTYKELASKIKVSEKTLRRNVKGKMSHKTGSLLYNFLAEQEYKTPKYTELVY